MNPNNNITNTNKILDGKAVSLSMQNDMAKEVANLKKEGINPCLCVVLVGDNPASISYVTMKNKACEHVGIGSRILHFTDDISQDELLDEINRLNNDKSINGILVQLPLPKHINSDLILDMIDINKDVDGFHPYNVGKLYEHIDSFIPATPLGIMLLLKHYNIDVKGKDVTIIGASNIVGKPLASLMLNANASVTICHIFTKSIKKHTIDADIVCVGVGKPNLLTSDMIKEGAIVIDIGINKLKSGKIVGDVDFVNISKKASFITPVPGGVGPMTISALLQNTIKSAKIQNQLSKGKLMKFLYNAYRFSTTWVGTIIIVLFVIFFIAQAFIIPSRSMVNTLYEGDMLFVKKFSYGIPIPRIPWLEIPIFPDLHNNGHIIEGKRPTRGEIVIFIPPHLEKTYFVKRTFAVGGDEVVMASDGLYLRPNEGDEYIDSHFGDAEKKTFFGKRFVHNPYIATHGGIHYSDDSIAYRLLQTRSNNGIGIMSKMEENGEIIFHYKVEEDYFFMIGDNRDGSEDSRFWGSVPYRDVIGTPWFIYFSLNLSNSDEAKMDSNNTYKIRWERMFKGIDGIEKLAYKNNQDDK